MTLFSITVVQFVAGKGENSLISGNLVKCERIYIRSPISRGLIFYTCKSREVIYIIIYPRQ